MNRIDRKRRSIVDELVRRRLVFLGFVFALLAGAAAPGVRAEALLRWKFMPGDKFAYQTRQRTTTQAVVSGKVTSTVVEMGMRLAWEVQAADPQGTATIVQTIEQMSASLRVDNLDPIIYDSTSKSLPSRAAKDLAELGKALVGTKCTIEINAQGEVVSTQPSQELIDALGKGTAGALFSKDGLSALIRQASFVTPQQAINPGDQWETSNESKSPLGSIKQVSRYTYAGPMDRAGASQEKIDLTAELSLTGMSGIELKESEQVGSLWFDNTAGRLAASETKQKLVTERPYREMRIRVTTTTTMEVKLQQAEG